MIYDETSGKYKVDLLYRMAGAGYSKYLNVSETMNSKYNFPYIYTDVGVQLYVDGVKIPDSCKMEVIENFSITDGYGDEFTFDKVQKWCVSGLDRGSTELSVHSKNFSLIGIVYPEDYNKLILVNGVTVY